MIRSTALILAASLVGFLHAEDAVPEGFEMQVLEPTGGKILRPKGWFYDEGHRENSWMWTISKQDTHGGKDRYDTGVRIQAFMGVLEGTGKTPQAFLKDFLEQKKQSVEKVHKSCEAVGQGLFTRSCLEVTEGDSRILYSVFWGNDIDIAVVSIAGAKIADWDANSKLFDAMSAFELIDMERFKGGQGDEKGEKDAKPSPQFKD